MTQRTQSQRRSAGLLQYGYHLSDRLTPDISLGRMFRDYLRNKNIDVNQFPKYYHHYLDGRTADKPAACYPDELRSEFVTFFYTVWIPKRIVAYFKERDPLALPAVEQFLIALPAKLEKFEAA